MVTENRGAERDPEESCHHSGVAGGPLELGAGLSPPQASFTLGVQRDRDAI